MAIQSTQISSTNTTIFQAEGNKMIATIIFCNTSVADPYNEDNNVAYLDLHLVKDGAGYNGPAGTPDMTNMIVNALAVPAGETVFFDTERIVLERGDQVVGMVASGAETLSCTISTVDI